MKGNSKLLLVTTVALLGISLVVLADSQTYTPIGG
jgi:hypothetical protein